jgi:membrane protein
MSRGGVASLVQRVVKGFVRDDGFRVAAALSYYAMLSLAPLLVLLLIVAGSAAGRETTAAELIRQMGILAGDAGADVATAVVSQAQPPRQTGMALAVSLLVLVFGATAVFAELHKGMNVVWGVTSHRRGGFWSFVRARLLAGAMVLALVLLILLSLGASATLSALSRSVSGLPGADLLWQLADAAVSILVFTALFAALFKYLPDTSVAWGDVWLGGLLTAVLFSLGKQLIGFYVGWGAVGSAYGAAGSLVALLVWIYYSAVILILGAELTRVNCERAAPGGGAPAATADMEHGGRRRR